MAEVPTEILRVLKDADSWDIPGQVGEIFNLAGMKGMILDKSWEKEIRNQ